MQDLRAEWDEPVERHEVTHQLEPGEKRPSRKRRGTVHSIHPALRPVRSSIFEEVHYTYLVCDERHRIVVRELDTIRLIRPAEAKPAQPSGAQPDYHDAAPGI